MNHAADIGACGVSHAHTQEEIQLSQDRRDKIIDFLLEWLTGDQIDSKTLGHFRFIAEMFGITAKVKEMTKAFLASRSARIGAKHRACSFECCRQ